MTDAERNELRDLIREAVENAFDKKFQERFRSAMSEALEVTSYFDGVSSLRKAIDSDQQSRERRGEVARGIWSKATDVLTTGVLTSVGTWLAIHFLGQSK